MNPVHELLYGDHTKEANGFLGAVARNMPEQVATGLATAGAAAAVAGVGYGARGLYEAVTKGRDFRKMLSFNDDLAAMHRENPKYVNAAFSTLRRMNPEFSSDPLVAGGFVRQMAMTPEGSFGLAGQAAGFREPGAMQDIMRAGMSGTSANQTLGRNREVERDKAMYRVLGQPGEVHTQKGKGRNIVNVVEKERPSSIVKRIRSYGR